MKDKLQALLRHFNWRTAKRCQFYEMAAGFIGDGKPVYDTLQVLADRWESVKDPRFPAVREMMANMRGKNAQGKAMRLGEAVASVAPPIEAMAIDSGEQSGDVANGLRMAAEIAKAKGEMSSAIKSELAYPAFLFLLVGGILYMLRTAVIPVLEEIVPRPMWPTHARLLGAVSDNAGLIAMTFFGALFAISLTFFATQGKWTGDTRNFFDRYVPPWNVARKIASSIIMKCFASFISAGVPFTAVIGSMIKTSSNWERYHLESMLAKMRRGIPDAEAIAGNLFEEEVRWEIAVYGSMSNFAEALNSLANRVMRRTIDSVRASMSVIRLFSMVSVAGIVIWTYGSMMAVVMAARSAAH